MITFGYRSILLTFSVSYSILEVCHAFIWTGFVTFGKIRILLAVLIAFTLDNKVFIILQDHNYDLIVRPGLIDKYSLLMSGLHHLTISVRLFALVGAFKATV